MTARAAWPELAAGSVWQPDLMWQRVTAAFDGDGMAAGRATTILVAVTILLVSVAGSVTGGKVVTVAGGGGAAGRQ